jgi:hypothetical protein
MPKGERKSMTYRQLMERIACFTEKQKDQQVKVYIKEIDEYYNIPATGITTANRQLLILEEGHIILGGVP